MHYLNVDPTTIVVRGVVYYIVTNGIEVMHHREI